AKKVRSLWHKIAVAASVLIFISLGAYLFIEKQQSKKHLEELVHQSISPGKSKAILTLANGKKIAIEDIKNGIIANEGITEITKTEEGQLTDINNETGKDNDNKYNEIEISRGGEFRVILPDGTKVWQNSSSTLKYPVHFAGKERNVEL